MSTGARKLATILALDAAGYSRQSEVDEAGAVQEVAALSERVRASAGAHGGRVFNAAGDGFMLEFPTVTGALACAEEIAAGARVPLRLGLHVGEVTETASGDLLGRGVNVAARLQQLAEPGEILVSGEIKRAAGAPVADRMIARGQVKLDKMEERVDLYALRSRWGAKKPRALPARLVKPLAMIGAAALVLVLAAMFAPGALAPRSERVAVLQFDAIGADPGLQAFAVALADRIIAVMSVSDLQAAPRAASADFRGERLKDAARAANVGFVLDGVVGAEAGQTRVTMHVIDARANQTLWSNTYQRASADAEALREQVAAHAAGVLRCALVSRRPRAGEIDPQTLSIFLRACDRVQNFDRNPDEMVETARQVTQRAPRFSRGWSMLALASAYSSRGAAPERAEAMRAMARDAAEHARRLDSNNAEIYLAQSITLPLLGQWTERQALISRALELEPSSPDALVVQGELLAELGRVSEALAYFRRAVALEPLSPSYGAVLTPALAATGNFAETTQAGERAYRIWPDSPSVWYNRFASAAFVHNPAAGLEMLAAMDGAPFAMERPVREAWARFLRARVAGASSGQRAAAAELERFARQGQLDLGLAIAALSVSGDLDHAFALARFQLGGGRGEVQIRQPVGAAGRYVLFLPPTAAMRRDPRLMGLARDIGLAAHWIETGRWPDFCADPALPYDCETEARR